MTTYNTSADSANTNVRAFLTKVGEFYLGRSFNTSSGWGKKHWEKIKTETFDSRCAYCHNKGKLHIEHLIMFNNEQCGLHHPGNIVPCCPKCNQRKKDNDTKKYIQWVDQLEAICNSIDEFKSRKKVILTHIKNEKYPNLTDDEINALRAVGIHLYSLTKSLFDSSFEFFKNVDITLLKRR